MDFLKYSTMSEKHVKNNKMILFIGTLFFPAFHPIVRGVQLGLSLFAEAEQNCREALRLEPDSREAVMRLGRKNLLRFLGASHGRPIYKKTNERTQRWLHVYMLLMVNCAWKTNGNWFQDVPRAPF